MANVTYQLDYHPEAKFEIDEAYSWYEEKERGLGEKFLSQLTLKLAQIAVAPETFSVKGNTKYREAKVDVFPYSIAYKIFVDRYTVFISSVHHQKKHPNKKYR